MDELLPGDIVQITDERPGLLGAFLLITEVKSWGVQGFVHHVESFNESRQIYLRLEHDKFERVGKAVLVPAEAEQPTNQAVGHNFKESP